MREAEDVVDEQKHVLTVHITEVFRYGERAQTDAHTGAWWLVHLTVDQCDFVQHAALLALGVGDFSTSHFVIEVVAFAGAFANAAEDGVATMVGGNVVNQFHNNNCFADAGAAEQPDLSAFDIRFDQVDDFDAGFKNYCVRGQLSVLRSWTVNRPLLAAGDGFAFIDDFTKHVHNATQCLLADWYRNW